MTSHSPTNLTAVVIRGVGLAGAGYLLTQILTLASYVVLARLATPSDFGEIAAGSIVVGIGLIFVESGMRAAIVQRRELHEEATSTAFAATVLAGLVLALVALGAAPLVGMFFRSTRVEHVAAAMAGFVLLRQTMVVPNALLQRNFSFVRRLVLEPAAAAAFGITAIIACAKGLGVWGLVAGAYASVVVEVLLAWTLVRWRPDLRQVSFGMWRELARFGRYVLAATIVERLSAEASTALVGRFVGTPALGQFQYATRVAQRPVRALIDSASYVFFPAFSRIADDEERFRRAFVRTLRWTCVVMFPLSLVLLPLGEPMMVLVFGDRWRPAGHAVMAMFAYAAGRSFLSLGANAAGAAGRPDVLFRMHVVAGTALVGAMAALLPFGLVGVAAGLSVGSVVLAAYALVRTAGLLHMPLRRLLDDIWPPLAAAAAMSATVFAVDRVIAHSASREPLAAAGLLAAEIVIGVLVYGAAVAVLAPAVWAELRTGIRQRRAPRGTPNIGAVEEEAMSR
jgi:O-antigen/teichoic acid export membrane protein